MEIEVRVGLLICIGLLVCYASRLKTYHYLFAWFCPWAAVICFSFLRLSYLTKELGGSTYLVIFVFMLVFVAGHYFGLSITRTSRIRLVRHAKMRRKKIDLIFFIYLALSIVNIVLAGYVPLISLVLTGNSRYLEFGVSGIYGFYNAFANAAGILFFFGYLTLRKRKYLFYYLIVMVFFVVFITRHNVLSLLIETFIIYSIYKRPLRLAKVAAFTVLVLLAFSFAGETRSGDIKGIAEIRTEYSWIPAMVIWPYSYLYLNIVNLDNLINQTAAPYFDGSSFARLVPRVFRPTYEHEYYLEKANFTVSSALGELYADMGVYSVVAFAFVFACLTYGFYRKAFSTKRFFYSASYSVLFFCAFGSFFVNFWFFLPIIFQIPLFYLFDKYVFAKQPGRETKVTYIFS